MYYCYLEYGSDVKWPLAKLVSVVGLPLPKVLKNMTNHLFFSMIRIATESFGFRMQVFS
jgi:hypothetical protein